MADITTSSGDTSSTSANEFLTPLNIGLIVGGGVIFIILVIILTVFCVKKIQRKRAFEGKYSPTGNEEKGGVGMNDIINVIQVPNPERLI